MNRFQFLLTLISVPFALFSPKKKPVHRRAPQPEIDDFFYDWRAPDDEPYSDDPMVNDLFLYTGDNQPRICLNFEDVSHLRIHRVETGVDGRIYYQLEEGSLESACLRGVVTIEFPMAVSVEITSYHDKDFYLTAKSDNYRKAFPDIKETTTVKNSLFRTFSQVLPILLVNLFINSASAQTGLCNGPDCDPNYAAAMNSAMYASQAVTSANNRADSISRRLDPLNLFNTRPRTSLFSSAPSIFSAPRRVQQQNYSRGPVSPYSMSYASAPTYSAPMYSSGPTYRTEDRNCSVSRSVSISAPSYSVGPAQVVSTGPVTERVASVSYGTPVVTSVSPPVSTSYPVSVSAQPASYSLPVASAPIVSPYSMAASAAPIVASSSGCNCQNCNCNDGDQRASSSRRRTSAAKNEDDPGPVMTSSAPNDDIAEIKDSIRKLTRAVTKIARETNVTLDEDLEQFEDS